MKVPIEFPGNFDTNEPGVIPLARVQLGPFCGRLFFDKEGVQKLAIDKKAVEQGYILLTEFDHTDTLVLSL